MLNKLTIVAVVIVSSTLAGADGLSKEWVVIEDGPGHLKDVITDSVTDDSGNTYVTGYIDNTGPGAPATLSTAMFDIDGIKLWENAYHLGDTDVDIGLAMAIDNASNVYVTGLHSDTPNFPGRNNDTDLFTVKYNASGHIEWRKVYEGTLRAFDSGRDIAVDSDGNVLVTGECNIDRDPPFCGWRPDIVTIKYDNNGTKLWEDIYSGISPASVEATPTVLCDTSCNVYVVAFTGLVGDPRKMIIRKFDPDGIELWSELYKPGLEIWENYLYATIDTIGNTYVLLNLDSDSNYSPAVLKYSPSGGAPIWIWDNFDNLGPGEYEQGHAIFLSDSGLLIAGDFKVGTYAHRDIKVTKLDTGNGSEAWATVFNGPENRTDLSHAICVDITGNVYVGGRTNSSFALPPDEDDAVLLRMDGDTGRLLASAVFDTGGPWDAFVNVGLDDAGKIYATGCTLIPSSGFEDRLIVKFAITYNEEIGLVRDMPVLYSLSPVRPNPVADYANIDFALPYTENVSLKIYDMKGRCVATPVNEEMALGIHSVSVDVSSLAAGVYIYKLETPNFNQAMKMVVK